MVLTTTSAVRDELRDRLGLVAWEERSGGRVACETVHRAKGLEADSVILATAASEVDDQLLYIGVSRAILELVVVGPAPVAQRLGLDRATG